MMGKLWKVWSIPLDGAPILLGTEEVNDPLKILERYHPHESGAALLIQQSEESDPGIHSTVAKSWRDRHSKADDEDA